jgi:hypothetical protein
MHMELMACESVIENEIKMGLKQKDIAQTYAMAMVSSWPTDWKRVNAAILAKWPKGLIRVKEMAWKIVEQKRKETVARMAASN